MVRAKLGRGAKGNLPCSWSNISPCDDSFLHQLCGKSRVSHIQLIPCFPHSINSLNKIGWIQPWVEQDKIVSSMYSQRKRWWQVIWNSTYLLSFAAYLTGSTFSRLGFMDPCYFLPFPCVWMTGLLSSFEADLGVVIAYRVRVIAGEQFVWVFVSWGNSASNLPTKWHFFWPKNTSSWNPLEKTSPTWWVRCVHVTLDPRRLS